MKFVCSMFCKLFIHSFHCRPLAIRWSIWRSFVFRLSSEHFWKFQLYMKFHSLSSLERFAMFTTAIVLLLGFQTVFLCPCQLGRLLERSGFLGEHTDNTFASGNDFSSNICDAGGCQQSHSRSRLQFPPLSLNHDGLLFQKDFSPSFWHTAFHQNSLWEPASRSFFPCLSSLGQVEWMLRFDTVDESFAEDLNQCRCDSIGRSANNLTERQADTIHTSPQNWFLVHFGRSHPRWTQIACSTFLLLCSQCLQNWDAIVHRTARPPHTDGLRCLTDSQCPRGECSLRCAPDTAATSWDTRGIAALRETTSDFMLQGLDSLTHLLTQRVPFDTPHSGSGAPRTGSLNFKCLGVLVVFDSDELAHILDAVEWQRRREQNSRITLRRNLHHIWPVFIPHCLQPKMSRVHVLRQPISLTCCVVHHSLVVACNCPTCVVPGVSEPTLKSESFYSSCHRSVQLTFPRRKRHRLLTSWPESQEFSIVDKHPSAHWARVFSVCCPIAVSVYHDVLW